MGNLFVYLDDINSEQMYWRFGKEKLIRTNENIDFTRGNFGGGRFLYRNDNNEIIGALNYTGNRNKGYILSNIYVRWDYRRQGIATKLTLLAFRKLRGVKIDTNLTEDGKLLCNSIEEKLL